MTNYDKLDMTWMIWLTFQDPHHHDDGDGNAGDDD